MSTWSLEARDGIKVDVTEAGQIELSQPSRIPVEGEGYPMPISLHPEEVAQLIAHLQKTLDEMSHKSD